MAISQNFPTTRPSLNLNFARSRKLDSRVTFTRGSTGTYVDESGLIRTAGINEARFDYDPISGESLGLLVEESRSNYALQSEDFTVSTSTINAVVTSNTVIAPDANLTADTITANLGSAQHGSTKNTTGLPTDSVCSLSVFVKAGTHNFCRIDSANVTNWSANAGVSVDLSDGSIISGLGNVTPFPNGWYRITIYPTSNSTSGATRGVWVWVASPSGSSIYDAAGTETIHVWGAQVEAGSFPTSYIPTSGSTVTRSADVATITGTNFTDWYNPSESSVFWSGRLNATLGAGIFGAMYSIDTTPPNGNTLRGFYNPSNSFGSYVQVGGSASQAGGSTTPGKLEKMATRYKINDYSTSINGGTISTFGGNYFPSSQAALNIGRNMTYVWGSQTISQISYYPVALTNTQLQTLTK